MLFLFGSNIRKYKFHSILSLYFSVNECTDEDDAGRLSCGTFYERLKNPSVEHFCDSLVTTSSMST